MNKYNLQHHKTSKNPVLAAQLLSTEMHEFVFTLKKKFQCTIYIHIQQN